MAVTVGQSIRIGGTLEAAPGELSAPNTTSRDAAAAAGVCRVGSFVSVVDTGNRYKLTALAAGVPTWELVTTGYYVVENNAERDLISPLVAGIKVKVKSRSVVEEYDGAAWQVSERGNLSLRDVLNDAFAIAGFYVNPTTGDDENDGSEGSPWATLQRWADEMPSGLSGLVVVEVGGGVQTLSAPDVSHLSAGRSGSLTIFIVGDHTPIETITVTGVVGTGRPANPISGTYRGSRLHSTSSPFATQINDTSHFLYNSFDYLGVDFPTTLIPIGTTAGTADVESNGSLSQIAILGPGATAGDFAICAYQTTVSGRVRNPAKNGVQITYCGCRLTMSNVVDQSLLDTSLSACLLDGDSYLYGKHSSSFVHTGSGDVTVSSPEDSSVYARLTTGNLRIDATPHLDSGHGFSILNLGVSSRSSSSSEAVRLNNSGKPRLSVANFDFLDVENATGPAILARNVDANFGSTNGVSIGGSCANVVRASSGARCVFPSPVVFGQTSGICFDLVADAVVVGLAAMAGSVTSALGATSEVRTATAAPVAFGSTPIDPGPKLTRWE